MVKRYGSNGFEHGTIEVECGYLVHYDDYTALLAENERLKSEAGYTAADVATAAADGFRDGVRSVDLEQFRRFIHACGYGAGAFPERKSEADRLLALIDAHKGE